jgi:hypothetical protein
VKCLWEGYEAPIELKTSGKQEPMRCPECGEAQIIDREKVPDYLPDELCFGISEDDLEYGQDDDYNIY